MATFDLVSPNFDNVVRLDASRRSLTRDAILEVLSSREAPGVMELEEKREEEMAVQGADIAMQLLDLEDFADDAMPLLQPEVSDLLRASLGEYEDLGHPWRLAKAAMRLQVKVLTGEIGGWKPPLEPWAQDPVAETHGRSIFLAEAEKYWRGFALAVEAQERRKELVRLRAVQLQSRLEMARLVRRERQRLYRSTLRVRLGDVAYLAVRRKEKNP
jgi:hypothetical protein